MTEINHLTRSGNCVPKHGCTRPECKLTHARYKSRIKYAESQGIKAYVDATPVFERVEKWKSLGYTHAQIAAATGISRKQIDKYAVRDRKTTPRGHLEKVLAADLSAVTPAGLAPALPAVRVFRALQRTGHTRAEIAAGLTELGLRVDEQWIGAITSGYTKSISGVRIATILELFDKWTFHEGASEITRRYAEKMGFPPPLAWDPEALSDPDAKPDFVSAPKYTICKGEKKGVPCGKKLVAKAVQKRFRSFEAHYCKGMCQQCYAREKSRRIRARKKEEARVAA